jgi:hypothetical protein
MTKLDVWHCPIGYNETYTENGKDFNVRTAAYLVINYEGRNTTGSKIEWYLTFFNDGNNKFVVDVENSTSNVNELCQQNVCYQTLETDRILKYSACNLDCFDCLKGCNGTVDCQLKCNSCFVPKEGICYNHIVMLGMMLFLLFALILILSVVACACGKCC